MGEGVGWWGIALFTVMYPLFCRASVECPLTSEVSKLVFYALSTSAVISGQTNIRNYISSCRRSTAIRNYISFCRRSTHIRKYISFCRRSTDITNYIISCRRFTDITNYISSCRRFTNITNYLSSSQITAAFIEGPPTSEIPTCVEISPTPGITNFVEDPSTSGTATVFVEGSQHQGSQ